MKEEAEYKWRVDADDDDDGGKIALIFVDSSNCPQITYYTAFKSTINYELYF